MTNRCTKGKSTNNYIIDLVRAKRAETLYCSKISFKNESSLKNVHLFLYYFLFYYFLIKICFIYKVCVYFLSLKLHYFTISVNWLLLPNIQRKKRENLIKFSFIVLFITKDTIVTNSHEKE